MQKVAEMGNVFLNLANFASQAFLTLAPPSGYALNLKALIKVSKVSWISQLSYEILRSSFERKFGKTKLLPGHSGLRGLNHKLLEMFSDMKARGPVQRWANFWKEKYLVLQKLFAWLIARLFHNQEKSCYSSNKIRKTQNERLNIVRQNLNSQ